MKNTQTELLALKITIIVEVFALLIESTGNQFLSSMVYYLLWGLMLCIWVIALIHYKGIIGIDLPLYGIIGIIVFSFVLYQGSVPMLSLLGSMQFIVTLLVYVWTRMYKVDKSLLRFFRTIAVIKALMFIALALSPRGYTAYISNTVAVVDGSLTLGFSNPNLTALYILNNFCVLLYMLRYGRYEKKGYNYFVLVLLAAMGYLIYLTGSRIVVVCSIMLVVLDLCEKIIFIRKILTSKITVLLAIFIPIIFIAAYYYLYKTDPDLEFMGFGVFSRIDIFNNVLKDLQNHRLFGNIVRWHFGNYHNGIISVLGSIGYCGTVLYMIYMFRTVNRYARYARNNKCTNLIGYFTILIYCVHECVESVMASGSVVFVVEIAIICLLCEHSKENSDITQVSNFALERRES